MIGRELRGERMGNHALGHPWRRQRCAGNLFPRRDDRERIRGPLVRGAKVEIVDGVYRVRNDEPTPRIGAALYPPVSSPACWSREEPLPRSWDCPPPCARGLSLPSSAIRRYLLI